MVLAEVSTRHVAEFLELWIAEGKNTMAGATRSVLSDMFCEAVVEGRITLNPVEKAKVPKIEVARERLRIEVYNATRAYALMVPSRDGFSTRYRST
ncbi:integrase [Salmonella enterica subsp. enterica serovar Glostrup]|nr:integrase [Salmonella enterica subsp. enterica serovar Glostrup]